MVYRAVVTVKGLENCVVEGKKNIVVEKYNKIIKNVTLEQWDQIDNLIIDFCPEESEKMLEDDIREMAINVAELLVKKLINDDFDIFNVCIESPSISKIENGKHIVSNHITLRTIDNGAVKRQLEEETLNINSADDDLFLVKTLQEQNEAIKFENLYDKLKQKCGNQIKVTEKIVEIFSSRYNIKCDNENIDSEYAKRNPNAKFQDDFTYLRTMISHGSSDYSEEIAKRLPRELIKIVKVIRDLEIEG